MANNRVLAAVLGATLLLGGCSVFDDHVIPTLSGEPAPGDAAGTGQVAMTGLDHGGVTEFESTGTAAGERAAELRGQLAALQQSIDAAYERLQGGRVQSAGNAAAYQTTMSGIQASLQGGTAAGGMGQQFGEARSQLDAVNAGLTDLNAVSTELNDAAVQADMLLAEARAAYNMEGVTDDDREQLGTLEAEIGRTAAAIDGAINELNADIGRQNEYVAQERATLDSMGGGQSMAMAGGAPIAGPEIPGSYIATGRPFVVIRFADPNVSYEQDLSSAISQAMQVRPNAGFDIVAVTPGVGSREDVAQSTRASKQNAQEVLRSLTSMGVGPERLFVSAMQSNSASGNEVHLYVR